VIFQTLQVSLAHVVEIILLLTWNLSFKVLKNAFQIVATKKTYTVAAATPQLKVIFSLSFFLSFFLSSDLFYASQKEWITDLNKVIEELVAKDPSLIEQRSTQIQTTKRVTGSANPRKTLLLSFVSSYS
jgi:hypothetical protein